ncbi:MAG: hypothetical protein IPM29_27285 [Planctomycetes bacterium]|nr:hypothetical protein [Planctomycetota bacterium]
MPKHTPARIAEIREHLSKLAAGRIAVADYAREIRVTAWTIYSSRKQYGTDALAGSRSRSPRWATGSSLAWQRSSRPTRSFVGPHGSLRRGGRIRRKAWAAQASSSRFWR